MISKIENTFIALLMMAVFITGVSFALQSNNNFTIQVAAVSESTNNLNTEPVYVPPQKLSNPPEIIKAVYVTGYSAGTRKYLDYLSNLFKKTEINAVVVDVKDYSGLVSYRSGAIKDIDALVRFFHDQNIYVIGRISVFEDPSFAKVRPELAVFDTNKTTDPASPVLWQDNHKLSWLDPTSKEVWDYNISIAKDALYHGFDEINFDYVRFPSDGKTENMGFPVWNEKVLRTTAIKNFFKYLRASLPDEKLSVDLFGQTTTNTDDMGIGQIIENAFESFDFVSPMVYPSHYIEGFIGFDNPAEHPYDVVKYSMSTALKREEAFFRRRTNSSETPVPVLLPLAKLRPWLQAFDMGADYTKDMVEAEIQATQDALGESYAGYMLWNPSNIYY